MKLNHLMTRIGISDSDAAHLLSISDILFSDPLFSDEWEQIVSAADRLDQNIGRQVIASAANRLQLSVYGVEAVCLLWLAVNAKSRYDTLDIENEIYYDSMADITTWMRMCQKETGEIGTLNNFGWLIQPMIPRILKLGRLQFEMIVLTNPPKSGSKLQTQWAMPGKIPDGIPALNVHIPEGGALSRDLCLASYEKAKSFFAETFHFIPEYFCCHSWLLAPELKEILPKHSNIVSFASDFDILCSDTDSDAAWRIFGSKKPWPQDTLLQRSAKVWYDTGNRIGAGQGIIRVKGEKKQIP